MSYQSIRLLYLLFFTVEFLFENFLSILNLTYLKKNQGEIPDRFKKYVSMEKYVLQGEYSAARLKFGIISSLLESIFLLSFIFLGFFGFFDSWLLGFKFPPIIHGIIFIYLVTLVFKIFSIPFSLYSRFVIEEKYGFNNLTYSLFFIDFVKELIISAVISFPLLLGIFWFMDKAGELWWVYAFVFIALFQVIVMILQPVLIAPLFNKFTPLKEGSLKDNVLSLARKLSFKTSGIFTMDGSKRSKHSNAYFTGFGRYKRIVLYDTLIKSLTETQIIAVLAHEIGHEKKKHIHKRLFMGIIFTLITLYLIKILLQSAPLFTAFGFNAPSFYGVFIILSICSSPFTFMFTPLLTAWSRKQEYQADKYAVEDAGTDKHLSEALITINSENLANLTPHPFYSFYHYSHPTLGERLDAMEKLAAK